MQHESLLRPPIPGVDGEILNERFDDIASLRRLTVFREDSIDVRIDKNSLAFVKFAYATAPAEPRPFDGGLPPDSCRTGRRGHLL